MNEIEEWYDNSYDEWNRLERHRVEYEITKRYLDEYITGKGLSILDIGGGPGRYSIYLANKGHHVTLFDLSQHNLDVAKIKAGEAHVQLDGFVKGNALDLEASLGDKRETYDVVLLMGPLYHLISKEDQRKAVEEAKSVLKKDGILIAAFISNYAPMLEAVAYEDLDATEEGVQNLLRYLKDGVNGMNGFTTAYFSSPDEAMQLMKDSELTQLVFAGMEGIINLKEREILSQPEEKIQKWIDLAYGVSQEKYLLGFSNHYLYIGRK